MKRTIPLLTLLLSAACGSRLIGVIPDPLQQNPSSDGAGTAGIGATSSSGSGGASVGPAPSADAGGTSSQAGSSVAAGGQDVGLISKAGTGGLANAAGTAPTAQGGEGGEGGEPSDTPAILNATPIAHYLFKQCGAVAVDSTGLHPGTAQGIQCVPDGPIGTAAAFPANWIPTADASAHCSSAPCIDVPDAPDLHVRYALTVAAWVRPNPGDGIRTILGKWNGPDMFFLYVSGNGDGESRYGFGVAEPEGEFGRHSDVRAPENLQYDEWAHVAGTYEWTPDGATGHGTISLWINGELVQSAPTAWGVGGLQQSGVDLTIGWSFGASNFDGELADVRVYDVALGSSLKALFLNPAQP